MLNFRRNTFSQFSNCRIFFFPSSISAVNSSQVFSLGFVMVGCSFLPVGIEKGQSVFPAVPWGGLFNFTVYCLISGNLLALKALLVFYFFHCMISQCNAYNKCNYPTGDCQQVTVYAQGIPENQINKIAEDKKVYYCKENHKNLFLHNIHLLSSTTNA